MSHIFKTLAIGFAIAVVLQAVPSQASAMVATTPAVTITAPGPGAAVSGTATVQTSVSAGITRAELSIDSVPIQTDTSAPFTFSWDTGANPLPLPTHAIDYGYMLADGRYGDFRHEVSGYTNLYHAWARRGYEPHSGATDAEWLPIMRQSLANAAAQNRRIQLNLNMQEDAPGRVTPIDAVLDITGPFWDRVVRIELADEAPWSRAETEVQIQLVRNKIKAHGLAQRPMGNIYTRDQALTTDAIYAAGLDFVSIEAYVDAPTASEDSQVNIDYLIQTVTAAKNRVPADKQIGLVMQAYARNNQWANINTLRDLQVPTYLLAHDDPRVVVLTMFSYGRGSGTREHSALTTPHRLIGERILGTPTPRAGDGPRTVAVRAYDASGNSASHRIVVQVQIGRRGDFVGDYKADPAFFRPSTGEWYVLNPAIGPPLSYRWGGPGDIPVPGDYLGDSKLDPAVYRPSAGRWFIADSSTWQTATHQWGLADDIPLAGDYVGDSRTDLTVYRPSTGTWYVKDPSTGFAIAIQWGLPGDIAVVGDYVGDFHHDLAVYRPSTGTWYIRDVASGTTTTVQWGVSNDIPVAGDYLGDYRTDIAVFRPSSGTWYIRDSATGLAVVHQWGVAGDEPRNGDYLGDTRTDLVVYRPSTGTWFFKDPTTGQTVSIPWGHPGDRPVS